MAPRGAVAFSLLAAALLGACLPSPASAETNVHLSKLPVTLAVTADLSPGRVLHAGVDTIKLTWSLSTADRDADAAYKEVKVTLCYASVSQKDRGWRKANDDLKKDKACQYKVTQQAYTANATGKLDYLLARDIPSGYYFVRAYVLDASGTQVAYGQTDADKAFNIAGITGITASIKVAAGVFSAFSVVSLAFFFVVENRKKNK